MPTIGILSAGVFGVFALGLTLPLLAALVEGNWRALEAMFLVAIGYFFLAAVTILALSSRRRTLNRAGVFTVAIAIWLSLIVAATPVFVLVEGQRLIPALFEAASAAVTLGTTLRPPEDITPSMAFYRATVAWIGGMVTLGLAVYVLGPYEVGGTPSANLRRVQHARTEQNPRFMQTLQATFAPFVGLTVACATLLIIARVPADDAIIVAMSMLSTSGFIPHQTGGSVLNNCWAEAIMIVFMILGATSIVWHRLLMSRVFLRSREHDEGMLYAIALLVLVVAAILASIVWPPSGRVGAQAALNYVFDTVSIATTTGVTHDIRSGVSVPFELILLMVFIGGCSYSTAGGIKAFRLVTMLKHVGNELERLVYPNALLRDDVQYDAKHRETAKAVWSAFFLAVLTITIGVLIFAALGHGLPTAMALAAGAFAQVGNLVGDAVPGLEQGAASDATLLTIAALTTIARIEILVVLAALTGDRW